MVDATEASVSEHPKPVGWEQPAPEGPWLPFGASRAIFSDTDCTLPWLCWSMPKQKLGEECIEHHWCQEGHPPSQQAMEVGPTRARRVVALATDTEIDVTVLIDCKRLARRRRCGWLYSVFAYRCCGMRFNAGAAVRDKLPKRPRGGPTPPTDQWFGCCYRVATYTLGHGIKRKECIPLRCDFSGQVWI